MVVSGSVRIDPDCVPNVAAFIFMYLYIHAASSTKVSPMSLSPRWGTRSSPSYLKVLGWSRATTWLDNNLPASGRSNMRLRWGGGLFVNDVPIAETRLWWGMVESARAGELPSCVNCLHFICREIIIRAPNGTLKHFLPTPSLCSTIEQ